MKMEMELRMELNLGAPLPGVDAAPDSPHISRLGTKVETCMSFRSETIAVIIHRGCYHSFLGILHVGKTKAE